MASEQPPERRPKLIDLNLLPPEYLPRKISKLSIALVILLVVFVCLPVPFVYLMVDAGSDISALERELGERNAELAELYGEGLPEQNSALVDLIEEAESKLTGINQDYESFIDGLVFWYGVILEIDDALPGGQRVVLVGIEQEQSSGSVVTIELTGSATKDTYISDYADALDQCEDLSAYIKSWDYAASDGDGGYDYEFVIVVTLESGGGE